MAKPLDPQKIEAMRRSSARAERRNQKRNQMREEIARNQSGNGVIVIPPQKSAEAPAPFKKLRVAAYCRVSTQEEQQVGSFEMQVHHFTKRIEANPEWEMVEIYQDEGISATTIEKRLGFQKMIADAVDGKIDLILTKSISRFGRNIVDILNNLRTLSALNPPVSVEFETEGITYTGDGKNNLLIALLSALAEMESQQKSEAIKAGIRWRMAEGIYKFSVHNTLGFYRDHFGRLVIEPTEARIVEYIYESCLEGAAPAEIAAALTEQGIKSPMGNDSWSPGTVRSILRNEKYCGDALMQKTYTKDFRTHRSVKNTDLNMYFKENHHTAIIKKEDWLKVQKLLTEKRGTPPKAKLRLLGTRFIVNRLKDGLFKGYLIVDSRWSFAERQEFVKMIQEPQNMQK
ncbi:resolvase, N-terminal domain protein [Pseudoflavonifractor capillosus ATCC 29799]|uniref:Resolvase, N-terminal domain protein n=1 Tax=Pseudoflavonifractor capillosus ATCC 29799 TaxID=411467 RepID=A6NXX1_9FIRM|nr:MULTISPECIES: recombinase family protein [Eubacteriales]EDM99141.1 resolvase, N-terminal domain protein [Pseudoflavonifractor capillosus ATCC 29799]OUN86843.1 resolvase [Gemmiger sp. An50]